MMLADNESEPRFDLRNAAVTDVETRELEFYGESRLGPAEGVASSADLRTDVVVASHLASPQMKRLRVLWSRS
jgi:hypothetical protein